MKKNKKIKIFMAMSGGVDSSVAAALLKKDGYDVMGVFMKFWKPDEKKSENRCCSLESEKRARQVAKILAIPFYVLNFEKEFKKRVVNYFLKELKAGRTPNPCVVCNREIKFGLLLEKALKLNADYVATGHYVRIKRAGKIVNLLEGNDKQKDQSYFLWQLNQKQLKRVLFPVGDYTRKEVENLARKFKLPFSGVKKSFEICFIPKTLEEFLVRYIKNKPGDIIAVPDSSPGASLTPDGRDKSGKKLGRHQGLWFYTIGQRKGIEINRSQTSVILQGSDPCKTAKILSGKPFYVLDKNTKKNLLMVTQNEKDLLKKELITKDVNWISGKPPKMPLKVWAKIRYRSALVSAIINRNLHSTAYNLKFSAPQRAITPGQSVVFYKGKELIGGGIIDRAN